MRYSFIILLLLLISVAVAEEVQVTLYKGEPGSTSPNHWYRSYSPSQSYTLKGGQVIYPGKVRLRIQTYGCFYDSDDNEYYGTCDTDVTVSVGQETWNFRLPESYRTEWYEFTFTDIDSKIRISATGTDAWVFRLRDVQWSGGEQQQYVRNVLHFRGQAPILLDQQNDQVSELIDVSGYQGEVNVKTNRSDILAWFGIGNAPDRTTTLNYNDEVVGCLDTDGNGFCDYEDEANCLAKSPPKDWLGGDCCGDFPYTTCDYYSDKSAFCGRGTGNMWNWAALDDVGQIADVTVCPGAQLVANGSVFYACGGSVSNPNATILNMTQITRIAEHDYVCMNNNLYECGGDTPYSTRNAKDTGESIFYDGKTYHCTSDGKWQTSLDGTNEFSCTQAGFTWTGTKCCGEPDDPTTTYEDPYTGQGSAGGCFNNTFVPSGTTVPNTTTLNYRGEYISCNQQQTPGSITQFVAPAWWPVQLTLDIYGPCGQPLADARLGVGPHVVCGPEGGWQFLDSTIFTRITNTTWPLGLNDQPRGCCTYNQCWNGQSCQERGTYYQSGQEGYRCV